MATRQTRYNGPPGDEREYWLPRDRDALDASWDAFYAEHPDRDPSRQTDETTDPGSKPENAWTDVPF